MNLRPCVAASFAASLVCLVTVWGSPAAFAQIPGGGGAAPAPRAGRWDGQVRRVRACGCGWGRPCGKSGQSRSGSRFSRRRRRGGAAAAAPVPARAPLPQIPLPPVAYSDPAANRAAIKTFVDGYVQRLLDDADPVNQANAREELARATMEKGQPAQPAFLFEYAKLLNDALLPQLQGGKASMRQRLNIAIVASRVAYVAENTALPRW